MPEAGGPMYQHGPDTLATPSPADTSADIDEAAQAALRLEIGARMAETKTVTMPTVGRIVHYKLSKSDVDAIIQKGYGGNSRTGQVVPAVVVQVWPGYEPAPAVNLHVLLDGPDTYWATSRYQGTEPGQWDWPLR